MSVARDRASALPTTGLPEKVPTLRRGVKEMSAAISKVLDLPGRFPVLRMRKKGRAVVSIKWRGRAVRRHGTCRSLTPKGPYEGEDRLKVEVGADLQVCLCRTVGAPRGDCGIVRAASAKLQKRLKVVIPKSRQIFYCDSSLYKLLNRKAHKRSNWCNFEYPCFTVQGGQQIGGRSVSAFYHEIPILNIKIPLTKSYVFLSFALVACMFSQHNTALPHNR